MTEALIVDVVRTPSGRGKPGAALSGLHPAELLATVLRALVERTGIDPAAVDDVICGCVLPVRGQAFNIARTGPVSYTHLDVYKRQILYYAPVVMEKAGASTDSAFLMSVAVGFMNLVATMAALTVIDLSLIHI